MQGVVLSDREELVLFKFGQIVDRIRGSVSNHFYHLLVVASGLGGEPSIIWDMFTMVRGEMFHAFIHLADKRLSVPPTGGANQQDISQPWLIAIISLKETAENILGRMSVLVGRDTNKMGWDQVSLKYAVP